MSAERAGVIDEVAAVLCGDEPGHPVRVAIDGVTASGKSTLAGEVASAVARRGRTAIHLTMDGFHHLRERRYRLGRLSARGYYDDAFDLEALAEHVLVPLGPGGDRWYRARVMDLETDAPVDDGPSEAPEDAVLIVDGSFLQRGELASLWDHRVFVDTELDVARSRGIDRDADRLGGREEASRAYDLRYHAACRLYLDTVRPKETATLVVVNDDPSRPRLVRGAGGR